MAKKKNFKFNDIKIKEQDVTVDVDFKRFEEQFQKAQLDLDRQVMTDMVPYMPHVTGTFIDLTKARSESIAGSGKVVAAAPPYGRYLYMGKVMVDSQTGKGPRKIPTGPGEFVFRYRYGAKLVATERPLKYSNPKATPKWFETAKKMYGASWVREVKKIAGGGNGGTNN